MWDDLRRRSAGTLNFAQHRWENPLNQKDASDRQGKLWPSGEDFFHPLNPLFSFFIRHQHQLELFQVLLLRDGAQTLLDFFLRFPSPKSDTRLLVDANLAFLVPAGWRPHTLYWRMEPTRPAPPATLHHLLFYGLFSQTFLSEPLFRKHLHQWLGQFPTDADVGAYFSQRGDLLDPGGTEQLMGYQTTAAFQSRFRRPLRFLRRRELGEYALEGRHTFVHMDLWRHGVSLCSVESQMMGRGMPLHPRGVYGGLAAEKIGQWPLSFNHALTVWQGTAADEDFNGFLFEKKISPQKDMALPFPIKTHLLGLLEKRLSVPGIPGPV